MSAAALVLSSCSLFAIACGEVARAPAGDPMGAAGGGASGSGVGGVGGESPSGGGTGGTGATGGETPVDSGGGSAGGSGGGDPSSSSEKDKTPCGPDGLKCKPGDVCVEHLHYRVADPAVVSWSCADDPCAPAPLSCRCAIDACPGLAWSCDASDGQLFCVSGGVCAHPDTPIATPTGERRIADLRMGDLVYSRHRHQLVAVPLLSVTRRPVTDHAVVDLTLSNGERLLVSGGHPTADGRRFADLTIGSTLGNQVVQAIATRHYDASHTYDILPDSDSGTYVAAGALIGSTLW